jgi:hypothetical protein
VRADERLAHDVCRLVLCWLVVEAQVVEGELERLLRLVQERRDPARDFERRLPAVGECVDLDQADNLCEQATTSSHPAASTLS